MPLTAAIAPLATQGAPGPAGPAGPQGPQGLQGLQGPQGIAALSRILNGTYTVATLPDPVATYNSGYLYAFVTDLGGGPDTVITDGVHWKHIRRGLAGSVAAAASVAVTALVTPTILRLTGNLTVAMTATIQGTNLYAGYEGTYIFPGTLSLLGAIGITASGNASAAIPLLGSSWVDVQWDGTSLNKIRGGSI